jgi:ferredoxin
MKFLCDAERCIECNGCVTACKQEHEVPWGVNRRRVVTINDGVPGERSISVACMHCSDAPCMAVCPVDCFELVNASGDKTGWSAWSPAQAQAARQRYAWHQTRLERNARENEDRLEAKARLKLADLAAHSKHTDPEVLDRKRQIIEAALARAEARRNGSGE